MRAQTLSPPPNTNKQNKQNALQVTAKSKHSTAQRSTKRINYLKSLVKKQQQKSLSRDFTNALMNTNVLSKTAQFNLFKSQNQSLSNNLSNNTILLGGIGGISGIGNLTAGS